ncbi:MAG: hypothetical protein H8F28_19430 [Fibrella sp.]|nr:hypothetical protein [Armatimonadota bacterium]
MNIGGDLLSVAATGFGLRLLSQMAQKAPGKNVIVSPLGPFQALSLLGFASTDPIRREILDTLKIGGIKDEVLDASFERLGQRFATEDRYVQLVLASALWAGRSVSVDAPLVKLARRWNIDLFSGDQVTGDFMQHWRGRKRTGYFLH